MHYLDNLTSAGMSRASLLSCIRGSWQAGGSNHQADFRRKATVPRTVRQCRIVVDDGGRSLATFNSSYEMVTAVKDGLEALKIVYEETGILHRSICFRNILITRNARGVLVDWDCSRTNDSPGGTQPTARQGTWQFMSIRQLQATDVLVTHTLQDDMESFLHVLSWVSLRFLPSIFIGQELKKFLSRIFDASYKDEAGRFIGGRMKEYFLTSSGRRAEFKNPPLASLLADLAQLFAVRYLNDEAPTESDIEAFHSIKYAQLSEVHRNNLERNNKAGQYLKNLERLEGVTWMLERLNEALAGHTAWPTNDKSSAHLSHVNSRLVVGQKERVAGS